MLHTRKPMTDEAVKAMAARNEQRRAIAKRVLGEDYAYHRSNHVQRVEPWYRFHANIHQFGMVDAYVVRGDQLFAIG